MGCFYFGKEKFMQIFGGGEEFAKKKDIINPNLLTGSKDFTGSNWTLTSENLQKDKYLNLTSIYDDWAWGGMAQYMSVNKGEIFTASAYIKLKLGNTARWYIQFNNMDGENNMKPAYVDNSSFDIHGNDNWQKASITFTVTKGGGIKPRIESDGNNPFWIAGMKLERGTNATPWCPAYEDYVMKSDLDALKAEIEQLKQK